ncbi:MAG: hypothetical protein ABJC13_07930 [Acidobacteriota bacterium]
MSRRTTISLVVVLLFLASVAPSAYAAPSGTLAGGADLFARAWSFLERLWPQGVDAAEPESRAGVRAIWANNGACIDPDGRPAGAGCAAQVLWSDGGGCIDPNGKPAASACANLLAPNR